MPVTHTRANEATTMTAMEPLTHLDLMQAPMPLSPDDFDDLQRAIRLACVLSTLSNR